MGILRNKGVRFRLYSFRDPYAITHSPIMDAASVSSIREVLANKKGLPSSPKSKEL